LKRKTGINIALLLLTSIVLVFNVQTVKASGTIYIRADGSIDPPTAPIFTTDNITYTFTDNINDSIVVERDNIVVDGAGYTVQGTVTGWSTGIDLSGRKNVTAKNTQIENFDYGIHLDSSFSNRISGNNITANSHDGIDLIRSSNNSISGNNITANGFYGILLYDSSNNKIFHNSFVNNNIQVYSSGSANIWDDGYPSGGNYWSDCISVDVYSGPYQNETGSDGIGDTRYIIDENNTDSYPLMNPCHDIAIISVTPAKNVIFPAYAGNITVTVENQGGFTETFSVTAYANTTIIDTKEMVLTMGNSTIIPFTWNTTGFVLGNYTISAVADVVANETDTLDNTYLDGIVTVRLPTHDVAMVGMVYTWPFKTVVGQGSTTSVMVTVENQGDFTETFNVTAYYNQTAIMIEQWPDGNNSQIFWSKGDENRDGYIDDWDHIIMARAFGSYPGHPRWNPDADLNNDGKVDRIDLAICEKNYGKDIWTTLGITKLIENQRAVTLPSGNSAIITFRWNTTGVVKGNYTISAHAWPVPGETDTTDNTLTDGTIYVGITGDLNADGKVDIIDIATATKNYGKIDP